MYKELYDSAKKEIDEKAKQIYIASFEETPECRIVVKALSKEEASSIATDYWFKNVAASYPLSVSVEESPEKYPEGFVFPNIVS